ncbi:MarR family winged helix-turn-helix transcriptional regulator [Reinekea marinisedimentorum]|uniref:DNA-binding MarR family transcriptional regulator n=1 Tax=Reinekea marinisedimentorum TaxID=230495 RepID=A0A4R3IBK0_9GAMM|nr:MarR family transcriptional regulator [Reinekea marinisedimentorum]TCS43999.1 DNA-binding MarR family transcriptional regulator [Reinekea marinisedimentorum]
MKPDAVDKIVHQWQQEIPGLATDAMATLGRLKRCSVLYQPLLDAVFSRFELTSWEFDVLATLRRAGAPYSLTPTALFSALMVTSGTMTHRLKSLESRGWIIRESNAQDARQKRVRLTEAGFARIDKALPEHIANMEAMLQGLNRQQRAKLDEALTGLLAIFEQIHADSPGLSRGLSDKTHRL